jgi:hypothetical protein
MDAQALIAALRDRARKFVSLDTPEDADLGDMAIDIATGFLPVVGTAQAGRDFERARRDKDKLGMALASLGAVPVVGGVANAANKARKGGKAAEEAVKVLRGPRAEALETARQNAVKMLGLPENNTAMDRARALGFETAPSKTTYHGARGEIAGQIDPAKSDFGFHTGTLDQAESRLKAFARPMEVFPEGANVLPLMKSRYANMLRVADEGSFHADALAPQLAKKGVVSKDWAKRAVKDIDGDWRKAAEYDEILRRAMRENDYHGIRYSNAQEGSGTSYAFSDPSVLRSRFAAFDPAKVNDNDLLGRADPRLLAAIAAGGLGTAAAVSALRNRKKEEEEATR